MTMQIWFNDPTLLFNKDYVLELWPTSSMCYEQKINSISRFIILLTILGYILTSSTNILIIGCITLFMVVLLYNMRKPKVTKDMLEGFDVSTSNTFSSKPRTYVDPVTLDEILRTEFKEGTKKNPFSNVLLPQINDEPERKAAPPAFNVDCDEDITKNVKRAVQMLNPGIKNTNKQLFGDLWQQFQLDQSNRVFYSTPNTRVAPDTGAYAQYLYNDMKYSGKLSTPEGAISRVQDNYRYTLY